MPLTTQSRQQYPRITQLPWNSHLTLHLKTSAMSCGVQPTASRPPHIAPALLPAIRFTLERIPASMSAYRIHSEHHSQLSIIITFRVSRRREMYISDTHLSVCLSVCLRLHATLLHGPRLTWGNGRGFPLTVHYWAGLQSVHRLSCYGNIAQT